MNLGISALILLLMAGCGDDDDVWSGASGWIIGLLVGILLLSLILGVRRSRRP